MRTFWPLPDAAGGPFQVTRRRLAGRTQCRPTYRVQPTNHQLPRAWKLYALGPRMSKGHLPLWVKGEEPASVAVAPT